MFHFLRKKPKHVCQHTPGIVLRIRVNDDVLMYADSYALYYSSLYGWSYRDGSGHEWAELLHTVEGLTVETRVDRDPTGIARYPGKEN